MQMQKSENANGSHFNAHLCHKWTRQQWQPKKKAHQWCAMSNKQEGRNWTGMDQFNWHEPIGIGTSQLCLVRTKGHSNEPTTTNSNPHHEPIQTSNPGSVVFAKTEKIHRLVGGGFVHLPQARVLLRTRQFRKRVRFPLKNKKVTSGN